MTIIAEREKIKYLLFYKFVGSWNFQIKFIHKINELPSWAFSINWLEADSLGGLVELKFSNLIAPSPPTVTTLALSDKLPPPYPAFFFCYCCSDSTSLIPITPKNLI